MTDAEDGLDLLLALADEPEGCPHADAGIPAAPQRSASPTAAADDAAEDEMDILCRLADEAEAAMVPGSPGAADVPFDPDDEEPAPGDEPQHASVPGTVSSTPASWQRTDTARRSTPRGTQPAASRADDRQNAGRSAFLGINTGKASTAAAGSGGWVKNPKYSSVVLNERLSEVAYISVASIAQAAGREAPWAVVGVLSEKLPIRASSSGKPYSLWVLSDLNGASVKLFLFGEAHNEHRQLPQGSLLAAYGGKVRLEGGQPSLTLSSPEQLTHIGAAADFGTCRSTRKDGKPCTAGVNMAKCQFCDYHVAKEFRKMAPRRGGFTDSLLPTGFRRSGADTQPGAGGRKMVAANMAACAAAQPVVRRHSAADMAAVAARDIGRRNGVGRRYMMNQAQAMAEHRGQPGPLPQVRAAAPDQPAAARLQSSYVKPGAAAQPCAHSTQRGAAPAAGGGSTAAARAPPGGRHMSSLGGAVVHSGRGSPGSASAGHSDGVGNSSGSFARPAAAQRPAASPAAAAPASGVKRKAPEVASREPSSRGMLEAESVPRGGSGGDFMELEAEAALEEDEAMWQRSRRGRQSNQWQSPPLPQPQRQRQQGQQQQAQQQQQQGRQPEESYLRAVAVVREAGGVAAAVEASKKARNTNGAAATGQSSGVANGSAAVPSVRRGNGGARPPANPNLPQLQKPAGPGAKRYDMRSGPTARSANAPKARAPLAARLNATEAGRSVAAIAAERARQQKRAAAAAPAKSSFAAAFAGIGDDDAQPSKSRYQHVADAEEDEELDKVMGTLERKDAAAARMDDIKVQKVKAWHCAACGYTAEAPAKACREAGHELARLSASKRWWRCNGCGHHFGTVGVRYPASRCPKCDGAEPSFRPASMLRGAKGPQELAYASRQGFQARGTEHGFCLKS